METPQEVRAEFARRMQTDTWDAVEYLHRLEEACGYLHPRVFDESDPTYFVYSSPYGQLEITINTSKPEKDPKDIFAQLITDQASATDSISMSATSSVSMAASLPRPQCDLCWENEEYPGDDEHPVKPGLRIVPIALHDELWGLQYSPYGYFEYHCIALDARHVPMHISADTFPRLFDFLDLFPFFFVGTNADLPYVGGSILSHEHMQGGLHRFALMDAPLDEKFKPTERVRKALDLSGDVVIGKVAWPASVIRLTSPHRQDLERLGAHILEEWQSYENLALGIVNDPLIAGGRHNTINAIAYKDTVASVVGHDVAGAAVDDMDSAVYDGIACDNTVCEDESVYVLDIVLRNNVTDEKHPYGVFHPDESLHHIKKENIGLIEIMGLAILPGRLAYELPLVERVLRNGGNVMYAKDEGNGVGGGVDDDGGKSMSDQEYEDYITLELTRLSKESGYDVVQHATWVKQLMRQLHEGNMTNFDIAQIIQEGLGQVFEAILAACGVFKRTQLGQEQYSDFIKRFADNI